MGRKRGHGGQFSRLNQPSVKRKKETADGNVENVATSSVRVELKNLSSEEKLTNSSETVNAYSVKEPA